MSGGDVPELAPGTQLSHVKLTTRKQDTVVFCVLDSYEVYQQGQQAHKKAALSKRKEQTVEKDRTVSDHQYEYFGLQVL